MSRKRRLPLGVLEFWNGSNSLPNLQQAPQPRSVIPLLDTLFDFNSEPLGLKSEEQKPVSLSRPRLVSSGKVAGDIVSIFEHEYRALRPRAPMPPFHIRFRRFVSLNTTIRLRDGELHVSLSDILEGAPESVLHAIAHILIAKIYKKPIDRAHNHRYKRFQYSEAVARQTEQIRHARGYRRCPRKAPRA